MFGAEPMTPPRRERFGNFGLACFRHLPAEGLPHHRDPQIAQLERRVELPGGGLLEWKFCHRPILSNERTFFSASSSITRHPIVSVHSFMSSSPNEIGTPKFEPLKPSRIAAFTPITFPLTSKIGPPLPPTVVGAS